MRRYAFHLKICPNIEVEIVIIPLGLSVFETLIYKYFKLPFIVFSKRNEILLLPHERLSYLAWFKREKKAIIVLHDLHTLMDKELSFYHKCFYKLQISGLKKAERIVCVSNHTAEDLLKFKPKYSNKSICVIHNAIESHWIEPDFALDCDRQAEIGDEPFVLMVGTDVWYKNPKKAIEAVVNSKYRLIKVGILAEDLKEFLNDNSIQYLEFNNIEDRFLAYLYGKANILFFPSIHEGFGWPIVEAMARGCQIVTSRKASIPEICGDLVTYVEPNDVDRMSDSIIGNFPLSSEKELVSRAKDFLIDRFHREYINLISELS